MYFLDLLDTTKSDSEAIGVLVAKNQILYVFHYALFNFYTSKAFSTLFYGLIDLISTLSSLKKLKTRNFGNF